MFRFVATISILCFIVALKGQEALYKHFTVKDGLPSNHIYAVHEDSQGYIWVCTPRGVAKYDGDRFRNFTVEDGLPTNDVWNILGYISEGMKCVTLKMILLTSYH